MELKQVTTRYNKILLDRLKLLQKEKQCTFQDVINEVLEIGLIECMKGDSDENKKIQFRRNKDSK